MYAEQILYKNKSIYNICKYLSYLQKLSLQITTHFLMRLIYLSELLIICHKKVCKIAQLTGQLIWAS